MHILHRYRVALLCFCLSAAASSPIYGIQQQEKDGKKSDKPDKSRTEAKAETEAEVKTEALFLKGATLHTMASGGSFVGSIHVVNGRIKAIGADIEAPESARVFDLKGFHITPGLIESRGKLWISTQAAAESNSKAELQVVDAIDPWSEDWKELAAQGITSVYVQPGATSAIGGLGAVLRVGPHGTVDNIVMKDEVAIQVAIGTRGTSSRERTAQVKALETLLKSAKDKKKKDKDADKDSDDKKEKESDDEKEEKGEDEDEDKEDDDEKKENDEKDGDKKDEKKDDEDAKKKDITKELFKRVLKREIPLFIEVHHSDALKRVLALAEEHKIRVVLSGLSKVGSAAEKLADCNHAMVVGPFFEPGASPAYRKDADFDWFTGSDPDEKLWSLASFPATARGSLALRVND